MRLALSSFLTGAVVCGVLLAPARAADPAGRLARQGQDFLTKFCADCHGTRLEKPPLKVGSRDVLLAPRKRPYVVAGKPEASWLWQRVEDGSMPPYSREQPSDEEKQVLRAWIEAGAPFPAARRAFTSDGDVLAAIAADLRRTPAQDRRFQRHFTLTHLANNPDVSETDLRLSRAALAKLVNSLSWQPGIVLPRAVDAEGTVYTIDLRRLGWSPAREWAEIVRSYPYGLRHDRSPDAELRDLDREVITLSGSDLPCVRADWFTATASRPPCTTHFCGCRTAPVSWSACWAWTSRPTSDRTGWCAPRS